MLGKKALENLNSDEILDSLGLMRKSEESSWLWPAMGGLGLGLICGVALGMAFAPKKGSEFREEISEKLKNRDYAGLGQTARQSIGTNVPGSTSGRGSTVI